VHAGSIPVTLDGFAMQHDIHLVFLTQTHHQIAGGPGVISGFGRAFGKNLEFPLAFRDLGIDASSLYFFMQVLYLTYAQILS
jgi:hypothetical protein